MCQIFALRPDLKSVIAARFVRKLVGKLHVRGADLHNGAGFFPQGQPLLFGLVGEIPRGVRFFDRYAEFINRPGVKVYLPKTDLRGKQFRCYRLAVIIKQRLAVFINHVVYRVINSVNARMVRNRAYYTALGIHRAFERGNKIVIKVVAAQTAVVVFPSPLYRGGGYGDHGRVVLDIEHNLVGDNLFARRVRYTQS